MTDTELQKILDESEAFWRQVAIYNHRVPVDRPKRKRPECLCNKPHLTYINHGWECSCYLRLSDHNLVTIGRTKTEALERMTRQINQQLDWDRINAADFIYIDFVLIYCPPLVFDLLPPAIQHAYA